MQFFRLLYQVKHGRTWVINDQIMILMNQCKKQEHGRKVKVSF